MTNPKNIILKVIPAQKANEFIKKNHYSGKFVNNSVLHFGCFLNSKLEGVLSYGSPLDKRKVLGLVKTTNVGEKQKWNEMLELNRMAFTDTLPRNSESRCIAISIRLIKKNAPHIKWIISFSDATQCGDGIIYRASGFKLTGIKKNFNLAKLPCGAVIHKMTLESSPLFKRKELGNKSYYDFTGGKNNFSQFLKKINGVSLAGYQLRYIILIDQTALITVPIIPFMKIEEIGATMYKGVSGVNRSTSSDQLERGGAVPTETLQNELTAKGLKVSG
jgi:hypothetical protein